MKTALVALGFVLVSVSASSSAFASSPKLSCEQLIVSTPTVKQSAAWFASDVDDMVQQQINQDGVSSIGGDTLGRAEIAKQIVQNVMELEQGRKASNPSLLAEVCAANLDVMAVLSK